LQNAANLKGAAKTAIMANFYGLARSLYILSGEEAIKAHITAAFAFTPNADRKEFSDAYSKHWFKHDRIKEVVQLWYDFIKATKETIELSKQMLREDGYNEEDVERLHKQITFVKNTQDAVKQYDGMNIDINDMIKWWTQANTEKNNGLYVNTTDGIVWHDPDSYSEADASKAKKYNEILLGHIYVFFKNIQDPKRFEELKARKNAQDKNPKV
jgi:AbiV family abortive infection protein